jgi:hypothetical protein
MDRELEAQADWGFRLGARVENALEFSRLEFDEEESLRVNGRHGPATAGRTFHIPRGIDLVSTSIGSP